MPFDTPLAQEIWDKKYRFRSEAGEDADLAATLDRVATAVAGAEKPTARKLWRGRFRAALDDFRFIPAGRILAGAGTGLKNDRRAHLIGGGHDGLNLLQVVDVEGRNAVAIAGSMVEQFAHRDERHGVGSIQG